MRKKEQNSGKLQEGTWVIYEQIMAQREPMMDSFSTQKRNQQNPKFWLKQPNLEIVLGTKTGHN
jgi:hypothetical protein